MSNFKVTGKLQISECFLIASEACTLAQYESNSLIKYQKSVPISHVGGAKPKFIFKKDSKVCKK